MLSSQQRYSFLAYFFKQKNHHRVGKCLITEKLVQKKKERKKCKNHSVNFHKQWPHLLRYFKNVWECENCGHVTLQPGNELCGFLCAAVNKNRPEGRAVSEYHLLSHSQPGNHFPLTTPSPCNSSASWVMAVAIETII